MNDSAEIRPARLFVGLKINPAIAEQLTALAAELKEAGARLVAAADVHLTLVPPWQEPSIDEAVRRLHQVAGVFTPFLLRLQHLGSGPQPKQPGLLWVDCAATDEIAALRRALMQAFGQKDSRPFRPHVTLARIRSEGETSPSGIRSTKTWTLYKRCEQSSSSDLRRQAQLGIRSWSLLSSADRILLPTLCPPAYDVPSIERGMLSAVGT